jgi:hypothetical protein
VLTVSREEMPIPELVFVCELLILWIVSVHKIESHGPSYDWHASGSKATGVIGCLFYHLIERLNGRVIEGHRLQEV